MPELRWTLLILGAVFVAALAWWELRKPRQVRRGDVDLRSSSPSGATSSRDSDMELPTRVYREPTMNLPDVRPRTMATGELPVIEVKDDTMLGLRIDGQTIEESERGLPPLEETAILPSEREPPSNRESLENNEIDWSLEGDEPHVTWSDEKPSSEATTRVPDIGAEFEGEAPGGEISLEAAGPIEAGPPPPPSTPRETLASKLMGDGATEARALPADASEPKVEWPDDAERTILALRLVASVDRFSGRALRQALMGEGFALGKMDIFHKAGPDGRAIISAASLTRPGTFSLETIDTQRFIGLNLFAVLPGPLSGSETLDELITTARAMNERLRGGLQDDAGQPLTPTRIATMRSTLVDTPAMPPLATEQASDSLDADTEPLQGEPEFDADAGNEPTPSPAERAPPP